MGTTTLNHASMYWIHAISSLHVGSGRGVGFIDLPILREKATNWPVIGGSAVKGVLADSYMASEKNRDENIRLRAAFGRAGAESSNSGSLVFNDARIVCLPVRSYYGTFAWLTSPAVLLCLQREAVAAGGAGVPADIPRPAPDGICVPAMTSALATPMPGTAFLEDIDLQVAVDGAAAEWATFIGHAVFQNDEWRATFSSRFAVAPDDIFNYFAETATEVTARVRIDDATKTVQDGALWYEESLPAETILAGMVWCDRVFPGAGVRETISPQELLTEFTRDKLLQIGGKATTGKGLVRFRFSNGSGVQGNGRSAQ